MEEQQTPTDVKYLAFLYEDIQSRFESEAVAIAILQELGKNRRVEKMNAARGVNGNNKSANDDVEATPRQLAKLKFMGVAVPNRLSKSEASMLIDKHLVAAQ